MLSPYRVLDLTDARAELGPLLLAGLGADVDQGRAAGRQRRRAARRRSTRACPPALAEPALPRLQPRQAQRRARPRRRRRPRRLPRASSPAPTSCSRTPARARWPRAASASTRCATRQPDLVYVAITPVRAGRPVRAPPRHRSDAGGDGRHDGAQRRRRPPAGAHHACRRPGTTPPPRARSARWSRTTAGCAPARRSSSTCRCRRRSSGPASTP